MRIKLTLTRNLIILFAAFFSLASCKKTLEEERNYSENRSIESYIKYNFSGKENSISEDVYHVIRVKSYGYQVAKDDTIEFMYKGYTLDNKVFDTNIKSVAINEKLDTLIRSFDPIVTIAGSGKLVDGLDIGLLQIREGEQATILFTSSLGFGDNSMGPVKPWSPLAYDVELINVNGANIQKEKSYISGLNLSGYSKDTSGLFYKYQTLGAGLWPLKTDTIYGSYKGMLFDGPIIVSISAENKQIILANESIPEGVRLGFMLTKPGGKTTLVLPSYLGYGNQGNELIEPYQTLKYDIELDSIK